MEHFQKLKKEQDFLLGKFPHPPKDLNIENSLRNNSCTVENLIDHKAIIRILMGEYFNQEAQRILAETQTSNLQRELRLWIIDWDSLKLSKNIRERMKLNLKNS